jgi:hypothetical protein
LSGIFFFPLSSSRYAVPRGRCRSDVYTRARPQYIHGTTLRDWSSSESRAADIIAGPDGSSPIENQVDGLECRRAVVVQRHDWRIYVIFDVLPDRNVGLVKEFRRYTHDYRAGALERF